MKEGLRNESEKVGPPGTANGLNVFIIKSLNFVFRKDVLVANSETVAAEFKNALLRVNEECNLLQQDHLARGKIVEAVSVSSTLEKPEGQNARWYTYIEDLWQPYQSNHPDDYWGSVEFTRDVVAASKRYP